MRGGRREYAERLTAFDRFPLQAMLALSASFMRVSLLIGLVLALGGSAACASGQPAPATQPSVNSSSPLCQGLLGHFIGLPAEQDGKSSSTKAPAAGRWWVKRCNFDM